MANNLTSAAFPADPKTGLTLPLSKYLGSQDLDRHRAMVAVELEVMAKKMDRFGWDRDRGSMAHDRLLCDWMNALQDYPLDEVQAACAAWVISNSRKMPNEGDIRSEIQKARHRQWIERKAKLPREVETTTDRVTPEAAAEILAQAGYTPKRMGDANG